jgi:tetratricopeptide (TPR) repeat protein
MEESNQWFDSLVKTGLMTPADWSDAALGAEHTRDRKGVGEYYLQAASQGGVWQNWCKAAGEFDILGDFDRTLDLARHCIKLATQATDAKNEAAFAHAHIADVLIKRGVYDEALNHANEAAALYPEWPWFHYLQSRALTSTQRFYESRRCGERSIRLSDGKDSDYHFALGDAHFELKHWQLARQSYEKASELDTFNTAAPYNVAICFVRLGYYVDAGHWFSEVLHRDPAYPQKAEVLKRIAELKQMTE